MGANDATSSSDLNGAAALIAILVEVPRWCHGINQTFRDAGQNMPSKRGTNTRSNSH